MTATIIGISLGLLIILVIGLLKSLDKSVMYALILSGIGFLYVGYSWMDTTSLIVNSVQAIVFVFLAYYGVRKNRYFLIGGYFLHGLWDLLYDLFSNASLIPPHYDLFCFAIDFTMGLYLLALHVRKPLPANSVR